MSSESVSMPPPVPETTSVISDLNYRNYDGPMRANVVGWFVVAANSLKLLWSKPWFYVIVGLPVLRYLFAALFIFIVSSLVSNAEFMGGRYPNYINEPEGQRFALRFWSVLCGATNSMLILIVALVAGAGCIAADNRANALIVYLARPITKLDYLFGKWLALFLTLSFVTVMPAVFLYLYCFLSYRNFDFHVNEPWLAPRLLLATLVPPFVHACLLVGISAWSKSGRIVGAVYASVYLLGGLVATAMGNLLYRNDIEKLNIVQRCSISGAIDAITQNIMHVIVPKVPIVIPNQRAFGNVPIFEIPPLMPFLTITLLVCVVSLLAAWWKIRAVEVVRG